MRSFPFNKFPRIPYHTKFINLISFRLPIRVAPTRSQGHKLDRFVYFLKLSFAIRRPRFALRLEERQSGSGRNKVRESNFLEILESGYWNAKEGGSLSGVFREQNKGT